MKDSFNTLHKPAQTEIIIKKSRFISSAAPVKDEEDANAFIQKLKKEHSQANHNVFAYVINEQIQRFSDDGEPSGTAGKPVLEIIINKNLVNTAIVVTRYFGGIMLGAGGLVRAYRDAAIKGIEAAGVIQRLLHRELIITMDYHWLGLVKREIENKGGKQMDISYEQHVMIKVLMLPDDAAALSNQLIESTAAQIDIKQGDLKYI